MATVKVLVARVKNTQGSEQQNRATKTLKQAFDLLPQSFRGNLDWNVSEVNKEEEGPLPQGLGYNEDQDFIDADSPGAQQIAKNRNLYLEASYLERALVLWIVPQGEIANANAFSLLGGYCCVLPIPPQNSKPGDPDYHTYAHEIMHGLGLQHADDPANLMYPYRRVQNQLSGDSLTENQVGLVSKSLKNSGLVSSLQLTQV